MVVSLRLRLFVIILLPLLVIGTAIGIWRIYEARKTAGDLYDRNLVFTAIAVARDMALLDGDAISLNTQKMLSDAAGGPIRYHVYAPDGVFVTGYAMPPVPVSRTPPETGEPFAHFDALYKGEEVRVLRLWDVSQIAGMSGVFTITVWQENSIRQLFVSRMAYRALIVIIALIGTVAVVVWFGVNLGLKPLHNLEDAISKRNPKDLTPIRRKVPQETRGIVRQLNRLIGQLHVTIEAQNTFISDAAHQLRNPIAGIHALGESILTATSLGAAKTRAKDLVEATQHASILANRLLTLERIHAQSLNEEFDLVVLNPLLARITKDFHAVTDDRNISLTLQTPDAPITVLGDALMLGEALTNLLDNVLLHGGADVSKLSVELISEAREAIIIVEDNGIGIKPQDIPTVMARFGQTQPSQGSGLGLPIAEAVVRRHKGTFTLFPQKSGLRVRISLPLY